jgi:hypothetical protein
MGIVLKKAAGGSTELVPVDGASNESFTVPTGLAYDNDTTSFIPNTLPSGAIIENGSNANDAYTKYADGTLVCSTSTSTTAGWSTWTFPHAFVSQARVTGTCHSGGTGFFVQFYNTTGSLSTQFSAFSYAGVKTGSITLHMVATGRWK